MRARYTHPQPHVEGKAAVLSLGCDRSLRSLSPPSAARRWRFPRRVFARLRALAALAVSAECGSPLALRRRVLARLRALAALAVSAECGSPLALRRRVLARLR